MHSQTAEYALRSMACLSQYSDLVPTPSLAEQTGIPSNYLAKVLQMLAGAGLITGRRGVGGGYKLARSRADITLLEIINAVDPIKRVTQCPIHRDGNGLCALHRCIDQAVAAVIRVYDGVTLDDLLSDAAPIRPVCQHPDLRGSSRADDSGTAAEAVAAVRAKSYTRHE